VSWFSQILVPKHLNDTDGKIFHALYSRTLSNLQIFIDTICRYPISKHTHRCIALGKRRQPMPTNTIVSQLEVLKPTTEGVNNVEEQVFSHPKSTPKASFIVAGVTYKIVFVEVIVCVFSISPYVSFLLSWSSRC